MQSYEVRLDFAADMDIIPKVRVVAFQPGVPADNRCQCSFARVVVDGAAEPVLVDADAAHWPRPATAVDALGRQCRLYGTGLRITV